MDLVLVGIIGIVILLLVLFFLGISPNMVSP